MLTAEDKALLAGKGITEEQIEAQLQILRKDSIFEVESGRFVGSWYFGSFDRRVQAL